MKLIARKKKTGNGQTRYSLEGLFTIYIVNRLKAVLMCELNEGKSLELDMSGIDKIDASGLQLLLHLKNEAFKNEKEFKVTAMKGEVKRMFSLYGIKL